MANRSQYIVRSTDGHQGQYIKLRERTTEGNEGRKYAWTNTKYRATHLTREAARKVASRYNGQVVRA